jgi:hypothetical protein
VCLSDPAYQLVTEYQSVTVFLLDPVCLSVTVYQLDPVFP